MLKLNNLLENNCIKIKNRNIIEFKGDNILDPRKSISKIVRIF